MSVPLPFSHRCDVLRFQYGVYGEVEDDKLVAYTQFPCRLAAADSKLLLTVGYVGNAAEYVARFPIGTILEVGDSLENWKGRAPARSDARLTVTSILHRHSHIECELLEV